MQMTHRTTTNKVLYLIGCGLMGILFGLIAHFMVHSTDLSQVKMDLDLIHVDPTPGVITIGDDPGGLVADYLRWYDRIKDSGIPVRVVGECVSACTFVLALGDQACIMPDGGLGFHAAKTVKDDEISKEATEEVVRHYYPRVIREWFHKHIKYNGDNHVVYLKADKLIEMGAMKPCPEPPTNK